MEGPGKEAELEVRRGEVGEGARGQRGQKVETLGWEAELTKDDTGLKEGPLGI